MHLRHPAIVGGLRQLPRPLDSPQPRLPLDFAPHALDIFQRLSHLHYTVPHHSRIKMQCLLHFMLCCRAGIEAHDEVVACVVERLVFSQRLRE